MGFYMIVITTLIYTGCAIDFARRRDIGMFVVYAGYAFANIGLAMLAWQRN